MDFTSSILAAENLSEVVYGLSERCLMAHSIRAIEWQITREYNKNVFPIVLIVEKGVHERWRSKSWAIVTADNAYIFIEEELSRDQKRVCIAHECYHILEFFRPVKSDKAKIEDVCDRFANELCKKHNAFYNNPEKVNECKFGKLPINSKRG
jgi:Zn-dependent peptidase ImmA (M78 family)